jgi:hypothetical protein
MSLGAKQTGERSARNPHAAFDEAGAGNVARPRWCDTRRRKSEATGNTNFGLNRRASPRPYQREAVRNHPLRSGSGAHRLLHRFMRPLNSATIRPSRVSRWRSAIQPNVVSLQRRAVRREVSGFARLCRQPSRCGNAPNSCLSRQGSTFTAKFPTRFRRSLSATPRWSNRSLSMRPT